MKIILDGIGELEEKYSMYYKSIELSFLGTVVTGLLKFNCIETDGAITDNQVRSFHAYQNHIDILNTSLENALREYRNENHIDSSETVRVSSVEFSANKSYLFIDVSWDSEQGMVAIFDEKYHVILEEADSFL